MIRYWLSAAFVTLLPMLAAAQPVAALPCSDEQLRQALSARAQVLAETPVRVLPQGPGGTTYVVRVGARERVVDVAGAEGVEAARVFALVAADLALHAEQPLSVPAPEPSAAARTSPDGDAPAGPSPDAPAANAQTAMVDVGQIGVEIAAPYNVDGTPGFGLQTTASIERWLRWAAFAWRVGYWKLPSGRSQATGSEIRFDALTLHAEVGVRFERFGGGVGAAIAPYWVRGGRGDRGVLPALTLHAAFWHPVSRTLRLGVRAIADAFLKRRRFLSGAEAVVATPAWTLGLGLGLAWGWS